MIGLGAMGLQMARHMAAKGFDVAGYDIASEANARAKEHGVKIVRAGTFDSNTPQTPGMTRAAAITNARTGANQET